MFADGCGTRNELRRPARLVPLRAFSHDAGTLEAFPELHDCT
jgi:hypothetical protein